MHPAALLWATVLASEGGPASNPTVSTSTTLPVAIIGAISVVVVALIPELFRWLRRNAPSTTPAAVVTPQALEAAEARITLAVEAKVATALERANSARADARATRRAAEVLDQTRRADVQALRDELHQHLWSTHGQPPVPEPREPTA